MAGTLHTDTAEVRYQSLLEKPELIAMLDKSIDSSLSAQSAIENRLLHAATLLAEYGMVVSNPKTGETHERWLTANEWRHTYLRRHEDRMGDEGAEPLNTRHLTDIWNWFHRAPWAFQFFVGVQLDVDDRLSYAKKDTLYRPLHENALEWLCANTASAKSDGITHIVLKEDGLTPRKRADVINESVFVEMLNQELASKHGAESVSITRRNLQSRFAELAQDNLTDHMADALQRRDLDNQANSIAARAAREGAFTSKSPTAVIIAVDKMCSALETEEVFTAKGRPFKTSKKMFALGYVIHEIAENPDVQLPSRDELIDTQRTIAKALSVIMSEIVVQDEDSDETIDPLDITLNELFQMSVEVVDVA